MPEKDVVQWICIELTRLLGVDATEVVAEYILTFEDATDLKEYMHELLDISVPRNRRFIDELLRRWRPPPRQVDVPEEVQFYRKTEEKESYVLAQEKSKPKKKTKEKVIVSEQPSTAQQNAALQEDKKKQKFVPLFSKEGQDRSAVKLPGRHVCECQTMKHSLINNCVRCGRIVCDQEGSGPCLFCGALVCTKEEQEILARGSKKSDKLRHQLMQQEGGNGGGFLPHVTSHMQAGLEKAVQHKNTLLHYDKTSVKRTQVIDDESDYFSTGSQWLSKAERSKLDAREEELRSKRFASRKDQKITLDFAGRRVLSDDEIVNMYDSKDDVVQAVQYGETRMQNAQQDTPLFSRDDFTSLVNPDITSAPPKFVQTEISSILPGRGRREVDNNKKKLRIQDRELQEMSDEGVCMSMHQPYASLLVHGVKIHEGRSWFTPHKGRLWIAAASKQPTVEEIAEVEMFYRLRGHEDFPEQYPVSCLLGCVDVVDCLAQDTYRDKYPDGESMSPFVFICDNPQELIIKFPMKGKHKIYKLDSRIHQAGKKGVAHRHEN